MPTTKSVPDDFLDYADFRRIIIWAADDFCRSRSDANEIYEIVIPCGIITNQETIPKTILEHLYGRDRYAIDQRISIVECGASGMMQEVSVQVSATLLAGLIVYITGQARRWLVSKPKDVPNETPADDVECLRDVQETLMRFYRPIGDLKVFGQTSSADSFEAKFRDSSGTSYTCQIERTSRMTSIKRRAK